MYRVYLVTKIKIVLKGQFIFSLRCRAVSFQCLTLKNLHIVVKLVTYHILCVL